MADETFEIDVDAEGATSALKQTESQLDSAMSKLQAWDARIKSSQKLRNQFVAAQKSRAAFKEWGVRASQAASAQRKLAGSLGQTLKHAPDKKDVRSSVDWADALKGGGTELLGIGAAAGGITASFVVAAQSMRAAFDAAVQTIQNVASAIGKAIFQGAEFGRTTQALLKRFTGGDAKAASALFDELVDVSRKTGANIDELSQKFKEVVKSQSGLSRGYQKDLATFDLAAEKLGESGLGGALAEIAKKGRRGKASVELLNKIKMSGLIGDSKALAKALEIDPKLLNAKTPRQARELQKALNAIDGKAFTKAILQVSKQSGNLSDAFTDSQSSLTTFQNLIQTEFAAAMKDIDFSQLLRAAVPFIRLMGSALESIVPHLASAITWLTDFGTKAFKGGSAASGFLTAIQPLKAPLMSLADAFKNLGAAFGIKDSKQLATAITGVGIVLSATAGAIIHKTATIVNAFALVMRGAIFFHQLSTEIISISRQLISGFVNGLLGGIGRVVAAASKVAGAAAKAFQSALQIRSPSKLLEGYGGLTTEGFGRGLDQGRARVETASREVARAPSVAMQSLGLASGSVENSAPFKTASASASTGAASVISSETASGSGGASITFNFESGAIAGDASEDAIEAMFRRVLLELGGLPT